MFDGCTQKAGDGSHLFTGADNLTTQETRRPRAKILGGEETKRPKDRGWGIV
jgi:hypothetical protein